MPFVDSDNGNLLQAMPFEWCGVSRGRRTGNRATNRLSISVGREGKVGEEKGYKGKEVAAVKNTPLFQKDTEQIRLLNPPKVIIIGSGVGGLGMAVKLKKAGVENFRIFEKAKSIGGTWRDNTYPGVACDIPSTIYTFSFFLNPDWSGSSAAGSEILSYLENVANSFDLRRHIDFNKCVVGCTYHNAQWEVECADGEKVLADIVISAVGFLHVPNIPSFEGVENFQGSLFHSSSWDHDIEINGKKIAIIGTGSSGTQIIPSIVDRVQNLLVFQRTPQWMLPFPHVEFTEEQRQKKRQTPEIMADAYDVEVAEFHATLGHAVLGEEDMIRSTREACQQNLSTVRDPALRRKLTPDYDVLCKRIVFSSRIYDALQHMNCELVTEPIKCFRPTGIETLDGKLHEVHAIVLSTGFDPHFYCRSIGLVGQDHITLEQAWSQGNTSFESVALANFPNFFMVGGPFSAIGSTAFTVVAELEANYIIRLLKFREDNRARAIVPKKEAQKRFVEDMISSGKSTTWGSGCKTWYLDTRGNIDIWTRSPEEFIEMFAKGPCANDYDLIF